MRLMFITILATYAMRECVHGAVIYSQVTPANPTAAFASHNSLEPPQYIAENFSFNAPDPVVLRSMRFIGGSGIIGSLPDNFRVVFLDDAGGVPGTPLLGGDYFIGPAFSRSPTGGQLLNGVVTPQEYAINLPIGLKLSPKVTYWLSISNNLSPVSGWGWARSEGGFDQIIASTEGSIESGPWVAGASSGGMWFELYDHIIPEPTSSLLLLLGITTTLLARPRK